MFVKFICIFFQKFEINFVFLILMLSNASSCLNIRQKRNLCYEEYGTNTSY